VFGVTLSFFSRLVNSSSFDSQPGNSRTFYLMILF
jgi:hypothetical protein